MNSSPLNMVRQWEPLPSSPMDSEPLAILHVKLSRTCISKEPKSTSLEYRHTVISLQLAIFGTSSNTNGCWCVAPCNCGEKSKCTERFSAWTTRNLPLREERLRDKPKKKKRRKFFAGAAGITPSSLKQIQGDQEPKYLHLFILNFFEVWCLRLVDLRPFSMVFSTARKLCWGSWCQFLRFGGKKSLVFWA